MPFLRTMAALLAMASLAFAPNARYQAADVAVAPFAVAGDSAGVTGAAADSCLAQLVAGLKATQPLLQLSGGALRAGESHSRHVEAAPFHWPPPQELLIEGCTEGDGVFADKSLGLWRVAGRRNDLPAAVV